MHLPVGRSNILHPMFAPADCKELLQDLIKSTKMLVGYNKEVISQFHLQYPVGPVQKCYRITCDINTKQTSAAD